MNENNEKELKFVVKNYRQGRLNTEKAWTKFSEISGIANREKKWRRYSVAVSLTFFICAAMACIVIFKEIPSKVQQNKEKTETVRHKQDVNSEKAKRTKVFSFDNTPIKVALKEISDYYGCELTTEDSTKCVSGEIESTSPDDAIAVLEATLNIKITRK